MKELEESTNVCYIRHWEHLQKHEKAKNYKIKIHSIILHEN